MDGNGAPSDGRAFDFVTASSLASDTALRQSGSRGTFIASPARRGGPSMRGFGRPANHDAHFGNRSAVFNNPDAPSTASSHVEGMSRSTTFSRNAIPLISQPDVGKSDDDIDRKTATSLSDAAVRVNALGGTKESDEERKQRFENLPKQNRFFELRTQREALRLRYIRDGVLPDPDKPTDLAKAKALTGTCMEMCPEFEREEREFQNEGDVLEMFPSSQRIDPQLAVKIYRRPAAGRELPLPEDVRPPEVLRMTLDYLLHTLLPSDPSSPGFTAVQPFMWNRTRAIRQDFIVQGDGNELAIECHERIARYHILCLHWRGGIGAEGWSEQQELEQLRKTIRSLTEFYEDMRRRRGVISPNEAEFRSYNLLLHLQDPETLREVEALPDTVFHSEAVQTALKLRAYAQRSNNLVRRGRPRNTEATMNLWTRFFGLLRRSKTVTYLLACLAENTFSQVRAGALKAMAKTYLSQHAPLPLPFLARSLGLDSPEQALEFAVALGAEEAFTSDGELLGVRLSKVNDEKPLPSVPFSKTIVEAKRGTLTSQAVVDGVTSSAPTTDTSSPQPHVVPPVLSVPSAVVTSAKTRVPIPAASTTAEAIISQIAAKTPEGDNPERLKMRASVVSPAAFALPSVSHSTRPNIGTGNASTFLPTVSQVADTRSQGLLNDSNTKDSGRPAAYNKTFGNRTAVFHSPVSTTPFASGAQLPSQALQESPPPRSDHTSLATVALQEAQRDVKVERKEHADCSATPRTSAEQSISRGTKASPPYLDDATQEPCALDVTSKEAESDTRKRLFTSKLNSLAKSLCQRILQDMVERKVRTVGEQACLREKRIRHRHVRERLVSFYAQALSEVALNDLHEDVTAYASEAVARESRARHMTLVSFQRWRAALARVRERAMQTARLHTIRTQLQHRKPSVSTRGNISGTYGVQTDLSHRGRTDRELLLALSTSEKRRRRTDASHDDVDMSLLSSSPSPSLSLSNGKRRTVADMRSDDEDWGEVANTIEQVHQRAIAKSRRIGSGVASLSTSTPRDAVLRAHSAAAPTRQTSLPRSPQQYETIAPSSRALLALRSVIDSATQMLRHPCDE